MKFPLICALSFLVLQGPFAYAVEAPAAPDLRQSEYAAVHLNTYVQKVSSIQTQTQQQIQSISEGLKAAVKSGNTSLRNSLIEQMDKMLTQAFEELKAITPPAPLKAYHQMVFDAYVYQKVANDALLRGDAASSASFNREAMRADKKAFEELERVMQDIPAQA